MCIMYVEVEDPYILTLNICSLCMWIDLQNDFLLKPYFLLTTNQPVFEGGGTNPGSDEKVMS